jgi:predicted MFS family arabinose efflux permease
MSKNGQLIGVSSAMHFLMDGLCICCMYLLVPGFETGVVVGALLTYNVLAFMSQPLTGMLADRMEQRHWLLLMSALLLTVAVAMASLAGKVEWMITLVAVVLGVGNSLFHVWGGKQTVVKAGNDMRALGAFVSTGALGLAVGLVFCSWVLLYGLLLAFVLLAIGYVRWDDTGGLALCAPQATHSSASPLVSSGLRVSAMSSVTIWTLVVLMMLCVCYRSFAGEVFSKGITKSQSLILIIGTVAMLGKMAGGWIARWMGILPSLMVILAGVALCFLFRSNLVWVLLLGVFLMNCTMPITLYLANLLLPKREGLAFGLLAAALIPGYLLATYL